MRYDAVLFDFSGTLFGRPAGHDWLFDGAGTAEVDEPTRRTVVAALRGPEPYLDLMSPPELDDWHHRDISAERNQRSYRALFRLAGLPDDTLFAVVFDRLQDAAHWLPYPDTAPALARLRAAGLPVGVLSNITWNIRNAFARHRLESTVNSYVLSYEEGLAKPDPEIFRLACERLDVPPARCLLIGDDPVHDGGAVRAGLGFAQVPTGPVGQRPPVLLPALAEHGL